VNPNGRWASAMAVPSLAAEDAGTSGASFAAVAKHYGVTINLLADTPASRTLLASSTRAEETIPATRRAPGLLRPTWCWTSS
jgi:hypothetical protein